MRLLALVKMILSYALSLTLISCSAFPYEKESAEVISADENKPKLEEKEVDRLISQCQATHQVQCVAVVLPLNLFNQAMKAYELQSKSI